MAIQVLASSSGAGIQKTVTGSTDGLVLNGATIVSADNTAIAMTGSLQSLAVYGTVFGQRGVLFGTSVTAVTAAHLTIGATGQVGAIDAGVTIRGTGTTLGRFNSLLNKGGIDSLSDYGVRFESSGDTTSTLRNYGSISGELGGVYSVGAKLSLLNYGTISGVLEGLRLGSQDDTVINRGAIDGRVFLGLGNNTLRNFDALIGGIESGAGNDKITNIGRIDGAVSLGAGDNILRNVGTIEGDVTGLQGKETLTNLGVINGNINFGVNSFTFINRGTLAGNFLATVTNADFANTVFDNRNGHIEGNVSTGDGFDFVRNKGGIIVGGVDLYGGSDTFNNSGGIVIGDVSLGSGDDRWIPGDEIEYVVGSDGADIIDLSAKGPITLALDGSFETQGLFRGSQYFGFEKIIGSRFGANVLVGAFEANELTGGDKADSLSGGRGNDRLNGKDGNDLLNGGGENDELSGEAGDDVLIGGLGADLLNGGLGTDLFVFEAGYVKDAKVDKVADFRISEKDKIDLSQIDAHSGLAGDQAFTFIGTGAFTNNAGELRATSLDFGKGFVYGDSNGDGTADLIIEIFVSNGPAVTASFFVL